MLPYTVPINVTITSNSPNPIHSIMSDITLTCTVRLIQTDGIPWPITINTSWIGPHPNVTIITNDIMVLAISTEYSENIYDSTAMINSFSRENSGNYTCLVTAEIQEPSTRFPYLNNTRVVASKNITTGTGYVDYKFI